MGTSRKIPYVVRIVQAEAAGKPVGMTPMEYRPRPWKLGCKVVPADGPLTEAGLRAFCERFEASTAPGGVNAHLGRTRILNAVLMDQKLGRRIAGYVATQSLRKGHTVLAVGPDVNGAVVTCELCGATKRLMEGPALEMVGVVADLAETFAQDHAACRGGRA